MSRIISTLCSVAFFKDYDLTSLLASWYYGSLSRIMTLPRVSRARTMAACRGLRAYLVVGELVPWLHAEDCDLTSWLESSNHGCMPWIVTLPRG